jgi:PilZ domain
VAVKPKPDRRRFPRVKAPVLCRPIGRPLFGGDQRAIDISAGGVRLYSDEKLKPGDRLELELFLPDGSSVTCATEVVWEDELPQGSPARYDVGVKFLDPNDPELAKLAGVLG